MTPTERDDIILIKRNRVVLVGFDLRTKVQKKLRISTGAWAKRNKQPHILATQWGVSRINDVDDDMVIC
jgi:hypothetical protein